MWRRTRKASDFGAEIEAHIALETERLKEQGLSDDDRRGFAQGDSCTPSQGGAWLLHRRSGSNGPRYGAEIWRESAGNAGAFQSPLCRARREGPVSRGRTAEAHRDNRFRQRGES